MEGTSGRGATQCTRPPPGYRLRDVYDVARMCFLEMVHAGITTVGEFHYLHNAPDGTPYDDPNLLAHQVIAAAQSVGLRIVLLRSAYLRSGYQLSPDPGQTRFFENSDAFLSNIEHLRTFYAGDSADVRFGVAPHSIRAVPLDALREIVSWARSNSLPIHMHVAEQTAENTACRQEYGCTPVELLAREGLLGGDFVAVHAIHLNAQEIAAFAKCAGDRLFVSHDGAQPGRRHCSGGRPDETGRTPRAGLG